MSRLQIIRSSIVKHIILVIAAQERQEVQAGFCFRGAKDGKMLAANMGGIEVITRMTGPGVIDRYIGFRHQASMQNGSILSNKAIQPLVSKRTTWRLEMSMPMSLSRVDNRCAVT